MKSEALRKPYCAHLLPPGREEKSLRPELVDTLRYAPKGMLRFYPNNAKQQQIGMFFVGISKSSGWRIEKLPDEPDV
jgi:hypothetical protein